ncbi:MAG: GNAT family N-acetyltransferase [Thermodesulfobacteriota bacterium]
MIEVKVIATTEEFMALGPIWNDLLDRSPQRSPYLTHEWLYSWWEAFGESSLKLHTVLFYEKTTDEENLIGILPAYTKMLSRFPLLRTLRFLGSEYIGSDFLDMIVLPGKETTVCRALFSHLARWKDFELVELRGVPEDSCVVAALDTFSTLHGLECDIQFNEVCVSIDLPPTYEMFRSAMTPRRRKNLRYRRRAERQGAVLEIVTREEDLDQGISDLIRLHNSRRAQKGDLGCFSSEQLLRFHLSAFKRFFSRGWLKLLFLRIGTERVAALCNFDYGDKLHGYATGFDPKWEQDRVGYVLMLIDIEKAISDKKTSLELSRVRHAYKYRLGANRERTVTDVCLRNGNFPAEMYLKTRDFKLNVKTAVTTMAPKVVELLKKARLKLVTRASTYTATHWIWVALIAVESL